MQKSKIFVVQIPGVDSTGQSVCVVRLVRATNAASSMKHCTPEMSAHLATQDDLLKYAATVKVEDADGGK